MKDINENYCRRIYDPLTGDTEDLQIGYNCVTGNLACEMMEIALIGTIPGSDFSDFEVALWSKFVSILRSETN